jgi:hypothetical protein
MKQPVARILLGFGAVVFLGVAAAWGQTYSHARIVRLSFVEGNVTVQRPDIAHWAEAPMNTPIQEGFKLSTAEGSFAEVEFENGSTVRLGQLSLLEFSQLALASDGSKIDRLTMHMGYATFHAVPEGQDVYEVLTSGATVAPRGKALFRVDVDSSEERVEVFHGSVEVAGSLGSWTLAKNSVLDLRPGTDQPALLSEGIAQDDWDRWVQEREGRVEAASNSLSPGAYSNSSSNTFYGWSDLSYYGNWSYMPGFGYGWMPNVYAGWYPYSFGRWCWYPGFGYTWISADPWGWLPYHYGGWEFIPGIGWVWFPGSFGAWSPGLVAWYGGPGWIGWMPQSAFPSRSKTNPCAQGQSCGTAVSTNVFRNGRPVGPGTILSVNLESGKRMERPDILPERQAMLPGPVVATPARFANTELIMMGIRSATLSSQTINPQPATPAPGAVAGSSPARGGSAVGSLTRHAAPGPESEIIYDPTAGRYVNNSRLPSGFIQATNELSIRPLPLAPEVLASRAVQPAPGTPQKGEPAPAPQSHGRGSFHRSSPRPDFSSAAAPRSGGAAASSHLTGGSGSSGGGSMSGGATSGIGSSSEGGGMGGGSRAGGGSSSAGGHR